MINPAVQPKPIDLNVTLGDNNKLSITTGDGKMLAPRITSNNKIQLKFATKERPFAESAAFFDRSGHQRGPWL